MERQAISLTVRIPETEEALLSAALPLAHLAPCYQLIEAEGATRAHVAHFPDLSSEIYQAARLIGEVLSLPRVSVTINARSVVNLSKFLSTLLCYGESLGEQDKEAYCARQADRVGEAAGCPVWTCHVRCPFICARCLQVVRNAGATPVEEQLKAIAVLAEVDWCPNLKWHN